MDYIYTTVFQLPMKAQRRWTRRSAVHVPGSTQFKSNLLDSSSAPDGAIFDTPASALSPRRWTSRSIQCRKSCGTLTYRRLWGSCPARVTRFAGLHSPELRDPRLGLFRSCRRDVAGPVSDKVHSHGLVLPSRSSHGRSANYLVHDYLRSVCALVSLLHICSILVVWSVDIWHRRTAEQLVGLHGCHGWIGCGVVEGICRP
ncbi:hypothetical protein B0H21DRAFT_445280 [Amylocystis lapponica]|nr:hypothetical protein B0H21DRAFT_445280 [Amylocystis lapponica]